MDQGPRARDERIVTCIGRRVSTGRAVLRLPLRKSPPCWRGWEERKESCRDFISCSDNTWGNGIPSVKNWCGFNYQLGAGGRAAGQGARNGPGLSPDGAAEDSPPPGTTKMT